MSEIDADTPDAASLTPLNDINESEAWAMVDASPDGMILADEHGLILVVNSRIETLFGLDRGELLGRPVEVLLPDRFRQVHTAHRTRYRAGPVVRAMGAGLELMALRSDGSEFPVEVSLSPVTTSAGLRVVATVRDITDRIAVEAHTHAVLHTIDAAHDGVFMFTADTLRFEYVNRGAATQLGYSRDELMSMTPLHIKPEFTEPAFRSLLAPILDGSLDSYTFITTHRRKDGHDIPVEIVIEYPPASAAGRPRLLVALVRDITERRKAEQAIRDNEATQRVLEDRERLARDLHDLVIQRLFSAGMGLQSIQPMIDDGRATERIEATVDELDDAINELRAAVFHLNTPLMSAAADAVEAVVEQAASRLGFEPAFAVDGDIDAVSDRIVDDLVPALTEILSNVARHANATAVDIALAVTDQQVTLSVADNGVGIDPSSPRGSGLDNLASRARRHGGEARVDANPEGPGTLVTWVVRT